MPGCRVEVRPPSGNAATGPEAGLSVSARNVLACLPEPPGRAIRKDIGDLIVERGLWDQGYSRNTLDKALEELRSRGLADREEMGDGRPHLWWRTA